MAIPEQVRKQAEAAEEQMKKLTDPAEASADPNGSNGQITDSVTSTANSASNEATSPAANEHGAGEDPNSDTYKQRWRTLQGQYNAEVPRLHASNKELTARLTQLEQLLASVSQQPAAPAQSQQAPTAKYLSDSDREEYGESIEVMRKVSREELTPFLHRMQQLEAAIQQLAASLSSNIVPQVQRVAQQQAMSAEERFWSQLSGQIPNWQQINNDPDFQSWLLETDPLTGTTRQSYLERAQQALDVNRVVAFFRTFSSVSGKYSPQANAQPNRSASELERQVAPGRARGAGAASTNQSAKTYTPNDIRKFFDDVRSGKYKGREPERDRIERDIFAAQREGRIMQAS